MLRSSYLLIIVLSILIPGLVAFLLFRTERVTPVEDWHYYLPHMNALINALTTGALVMGLISIKRGRKRAHKIFMLTAFSLGTIFLISYLIYHSSVPSTIYGDSDGNGLLDVSEKAALGLIHPVYITLLLSHIGLAFLVVPFVLLALYQALKGDFERHRRVVKFAYPIWLYVSFTGVIVYLMIRPYYVF